MTRFNRFRCGFVGALAAALAPSASFAQAKWPMAKPMTIVVPWPAGSSFDVVARLLADGVQKRYLVREALIAATEAFAELRAEQS